MTNKDVIIAQLLRQNEQQANHIQWLTKSFENKMQLLTAENQELRERITRLEKNSSNSSKPPSSDIINPKPTLKKWAETQAWRSAWAQKIFQRTVYI